MVCRKNSGRKYAVSKHCKILQVAKIRNTTKFRRWRKFATCEILQVAKIRNLRNSAGCEKSRPAKFYRLRNFRNPAKFHCFLFSSTFCSSFLAFSAHLSFWSLICNAENSSCLDRLDNFGINSLQKLQNYPQNAIIRIVGTLMCKSG